MSIRGGVGDFFCYFRKSKAPRRWVRDFLAACKFSVDVLEAPAIGGKYFDGADFEPAEVFCGDGGIAEETAGLFGGEIHWEVRRTIYDLRIWRSWGEGIISI